MASGLPQLKPRLASFGMVLSSSAEYPKACAIAVLYVGLLARAIEP